MRSARARTVSSGAVAIAQNGTVRHADLSMNDMRVRCSAMSVWPPGRSARING